MQQNKKANSVKSFTFHLVNKESCLALPFSLKFGDRLSTYLNIKY